MDIKEIIEKAVRDYGRIDIRFEADTKNDTPVRMVISVGNDLDTFNTYYKGSTQELFDDFPEGIERALVEQDKLDAGVRERGGVREG